MQEKKKTKLQIISGVGKHKNNGSSFLGINYRFWCSHIFYPAIQDEDYASF